MILMCDKRKFIYRFCNAENIIADNKHNYWVLKLNYIEKIEYSKDSKVKILCNKGLFFVVFFTNLLKCRKLKHRVPTGKLIAHRGSKQKHFLLFCSG